MTLQTLTSSWLALPKKTFSRQAMQTSDEIRCDCSGFINLLCGHLDLPRPYSIAHPKAVHYFAILQEIGSNHIGQVKPWSLMAWRKESVPRSGDSGHVLLIAAEPVQLEETVYRVDVIDATKVENGIARRQIRLHTNVDGQLIGVQLHLSESKVKRTPIYHSPLLNKRYCLGCGVPKKLCLCNQVEVSLAEPAVVILRHPEERKKTLSTVSLIKQRYPAVLVKEGEIFPPIRSRSMALLFPGDGSTSESVKTGSEKVAFEQLDQTTVVVLDATWRKAKRMLFENSWLAELPRLSIEAKAISDYLLRKVPGPDALSTVEAFALLQKDLALQELLGVFMQKQIELMGQDKYRSNYQGYVNYTPS